MEWEFEEVNKFLHIVCFSHFLKRRRGSRRRSNQWKIPYFYFMQMNQSAKLTEQTKSLFHLRSHNWKENIACEQNQKRLKIIFISNEFRSGKHQHDMLSLRKSESRTNFLPNFNGFTSIRLARDFLLHSVTHNEPSSSSVFQPFRYEIFCSFYIQSREKYRGPPTILFLKVFWIQLHTKVFRE